MRVLVIGRTEWLYNTILKLNELAHEVVMIITAKASPEYERKEDDFKELAEELGIPYINSVRLSEHYDEITSVKADIAVSMNWPSILNYNFIGLFKYGVLNAHPGDLPRYRGNACPNWAMLNHEDKVALTVHEMIPGELDSGDIWVKKYIYGIQEKTIGEIYRELSQLVPEAYAEALEKIEKNSDIPVPQSETGMLPLRCYPRKIMDSLINWKDNAEDIIRLVKASSKPFAGAYTYFDGKRFIIWDAYIKPFENDILGIPGQVAWRDKVTGEVGIIAGNGYVVLTAAGYDGNDVLPADILTSLRFRLGMNIEEEIEKLWAIIRNKTEI